VCGPHHVNVERRRQLQQVDQDITDRELYGAEIYGLDMADAEPEKKSYLWLYALSGLFALVLYIVQASGWL